MSNPYLARTRFSSSPPSAKICNSPTTLRGIKISKLINPVLATAKKRPSIKIEVSTNICFFAFEINGLSFLKSNQIPQTINKIKKESRIYLQETGKDASPEILAERLGMEVEKIKAIQEMNQEPISLETPVGSEEDSELGDFVEDQKTTSPYEATNRAILREELDGVLKTLSPREEKVLRYRYGLDDSSPKTLEEVGKIFNVTRERIRQIEVKALRKLRHPSRKKKLEDFKVD